MRLERAPIAGPTSRIVIFFCDCSFSDISFIYDVDEPIQVDKFNCDDYNIPKYMYCIMIGMVSTNI